MKMKARRRRSVAKDEVPADLPLDDLLSKKPQEEPETERTIPTEPGEAIETQLGDSPAIVRQKLYEARPMSIEEAIDEMELVGHPFYIFIDEETKQPCAAYRRRGWTYGIIRLDATTADFGPGEA